LFTWGLDGGAAEILDSERVALCTDYPLSVLRVIRTSTAREEGALRSLGDGVGAGEQEYRRAVVRIREASRRADPPLRSYGHRFLRRLAARYNIANDVK